MTPITEGWSYCPTETPTIGLREDTVMFSQTGKMESNTGLLSLIFFPKKEGKYVPNSSHKEGKA